MTEGDVFDPDEHHWHSYGEGYWQRDDGNASVLLESDGRYRVNDISHTIRRREYVVGHTRSLKGAAALAESIPMDLDRAEKHRAYINGGPFPEPPA